MRCLQGSRQRVDLALQLRDPAIRLLLTFPRGLGDDARASGFGASLARAIWMGWVRITPDLELATGLASARPFDVLMRLFGSAGSAGRVWPQTEMLPVGWGYTIGAVRLAGDM
jgi:hypothetical protein